MARAAFNRLQPSPWSRPEVPRRTKGRAYESVVKTILIYGYKTWPLRVEDQRCLEVLANDWLDCILGRQRRDPVPCDVLRHRLHLRNLPPTLLQRRLRWVGHAARRRAVEIIRDVVDPVLLTHWRWN